MPVTIYSSDDKPSEQTTFGFEVLRWDDGWCNLSPYGKKNFHGPPFFKLVFGTGTNSAISLNVCLMCLRDVVQETSRTFLEEIVRISKEQRENDRSKHEPDI